MMDVSAAPATVMLDSGRTAQGPVPAPRLDLLSIGQAPVSTSRAISERLRTTLPRLQAYVNAEATDTNVKSRAIVRDNIRLAYREMTSGAWLDAERRVNQALSEIANNANR